MKNRFFKDKSIDIVKFYSSYCNYSNSYIPPYVHFLIDEKEYDALKRIFIVDYYDLYPSYNNTIFKTVTYFINIIDFLYCLFLILLVVAVTGLVLLILGMIGFMNAFISLHDFTVLSIYTAIFFVMFKISASYLDKNDMYSLSKNRIAELINSKQRRYYKVLEKMYL